MQNPVCHFNRVLRSYRLYLAKEEKQVKFRFDSGLQTLQKHCPLNLIPKLWMGWNIHLSMFTKTVETGKSTNPCCQSVVVWGDKQVVRPPATANFFIFPQSDALFAGRIHLIYITSTGPGMFYCFFVRYTAFRITPLGTDKKWGMAACIVIFHWGLSDYLVISMCHANRWSLHQAGWCTFEMSHFCL